ncbi:hypothetical protein ACIBF5_06665 [Micromonospora sp. NPDC050417]|uniref:hypothetical protein n=1 Tax=Micromonospora sp. NPDC050417 TaxID=3364280 RepID=UPI0037BB0D7B
MTYDIDFVRRRPGRSLVETMEEIVAEEAVTYDPEADPQPISLTAEQRAGWERIVRRVAEELGPVTVTEYPSNLSLWREGPNSYYQFVHRGESAYIEIPYRYPHEAALPVAVEAYRLGRIVEEETDLEGYDAEVEQDVRTGDPQVAAARLGGVAAWAWKNLS